MIKMNILKVMYNFSPIKFYSYGEDYTVIKSVNNTSLGYKFGKIFTDEEIKTVWEEIKLCKRWSTILIFILFILLLYAVIFPNFQLFVNNSRILIALVVLVAAGIICQIITKICTFCFEKRLSNIFGKYEKTKFPKNAPIDAKYYSLFKTELIKALILILVIVGCFSIGSPLKKTYNLIESQKYDEAIRLATVGSKLFPIAQEWYSLRGYSKFQTGDYEGAIKDYDKAYTLGADGFNMMNFDNKIFIKYYLGDLKGAIADFDKEIANSDNEDEKDQYLWDKAQFLYYAKKYDDALSLYSELIDKAENDRIYLLKDRLYLERAQVYKALGKQEQAQSDFVNSGISEDEYGQNPIPQPTLMLDEF